VQQQNASNARVDQKSNIIKITQLAKEQQNSCFVQRT
jgi:hypothetical protein